MAMLYDNGIHFFYMKICSITKMENVEGQMAAMQVDDASIYEVLKQKYMELKEEHAQAIEAIDDHCETIRDLHHVLQQIKQKNQMLQVCSLFAYFFFLCHFVAVWKIVFV